MQQNRKAGHLARAKSNQVEYAHSNTVATIEAVEKKRNRYLSGFIGSVALGIGLLAAASQSDNPETKSWAIPPESTLIVMAGFTAGRLVREQLDLNKHRQQESKQAELMVAYCQLGKLTVPMWARGHVTDERIAEVEEYAVERVQP